ncbi:MAG: ABC transporter ATP-binding protein [Phycisphaerales bacterium]
MSQSTRPTPSQPEPAGSSAPDHPGAVVIAANAVHKTYRLGRVRVPVLRGVDFQVRQGECVAVLGASGSGKSTLLHLLGGLDRPDRSGSSAGGEITFEGRSLARYSSSELDRYRRTAVGFVFQFYHLLPELTVMQNVLIGAMVGSGRVAWLARRADAEAHARTLLDRFGLAHRLRHRPVELSGGERQRVAIARALINKPRLLLADEPTGNLDQGTGASILDAMMDLRATIGQTMVIVTHDQATAARADRIVRLVDGQVQHPSPG